MTFEDVVRFHGHACPGLALGFRAAEAALAELNITRAHDEELAAICENSSCAVDAIQVLTGCTAGKGNLFFKDYGKQVYTFIRRADGRAVRISVTWKTPAEDAAVSESWEKFRTGDRSPDIVRMVQAAKGKKMRAILDSSLEELFDIRPVKLDMPPLAKIFPSVRCAHCGEKVMEPKIRTVDGQPLCIPCSEK